MVQDAITRFNVKWIEQPASGCWLWQAGKDTNGYGRFYFGGVMGSAHRFSYKQHRGFLPREGKVLDHLCRHRECVNPWHLRQLTQRENLLVGETVTAARAAKTHCPAGHEYNDVNTYVDKKNRRVCRACHAAHERRYRARKKLP